MAPVAMLAAAVALPAVIVAAGGALAWREIQRSATGELERTVDGAAEYATRIVESHVLAGQLINQMLAGLTDRDVRRLEGEIHQRLRRLMPQVPMANAITLSGADGQALLSSAIYPVAATPGADREWVQALRRADAPDVYVSGVERAASDGRLFFGVALRREPSGKARSGSGFDGVITISVDPNRFGAGLGTITREANDVISLVRADGEVLARMPGFAERPPVIPPNSPLRAAAAGGVDRGLYTGRTMGLRPDGSTGDPLTIAFRRLGTLPLYVTVSRPPHLAVARWRRVMLALAAVGVPATLLLAGLALVVRRGQRGLASSEAELRAAFESAAIGNALVEVATNRFVRVNRRFCELTGYAEAELLDGMSRRQILHPDEPDRPAATERVERYRRKDGSTVWVHACIAPVDDGAGTRPALAVLAVQDVTERKDAEARQLLLTAELDHRVKNILAVVKAIARRSLDGSAGAEAFVGRLTALAQAHGALAENRWRGASLRGLLEAAVSPYRNGPAGRIVLDGPDLLLNPRAAQALSLSFHELASNAAKYGALSLASGNLAVHWRTVADGEPHLAIDWSERNGPAVTPPERTGFGVRLIEQTLSYDLRGAARLDYRAAGLQASLTFPMAELVAGSDATAAPPAAAPVAAAAPEAAVLAGRRVLVVEDEHMVAASLEALLVGLGCVVVGPAPRLATALALADSEPLDAAILDVNLNGELVWPVAERLAERGIGFLFATGYAGDGVVPDHLRHVPHLGKPAREEELVALLAGLVAPAG